MYWKIAEEFLKGSKEIKIMVNVAKKLRNMENRIWKSKIYPTAIAEKNVYTSIHILCKVPSENI